MLFSDKLIQQIKQNKSIVCIGLDPQFGGSNAIPSFLLNQTNDNRNDAILKFNKAIIDATHSIAVVFKPQIAFYEMYDAYDALRKTIEYVHHLSGLVILDAKRNDIGNTSEAYAEAVFKRFDADAVTLNSYLGIDGVAPFLKYIPIEKGVILLLKTSNKSSGEFQDLFAVNLPDVKPDEVEVTVKQIHLVRNFLVMTRLMRSWSEDPKYIDSSAIKGEYGYSSVGGVVGATYPNQLKAVRREAPQNFLLIPGYGAQGGTAADIVFGVNDDGLGAIVNASRSILYAYATAPYKSQYSPEEFAQAARAAAVDMQDAINTALRNAGKIAY